MTHLLAMKSPLMDKGSNPAGMAFDQRGTAYPRALNAVPDIGAIDVIGSLIVRNTNDSDMDSFRQVDQRRQQRGGNAHDHIRSGFLRNGEDDCVDERRDQRHGRLDHHRARCEVVDDRRQSVSSVLIGGDFAKFSASGMTITGAKGFGMQLSNTAVVVDSCVITGNSSTGDGGGISVAGGGLTVTDCTVSNNSAANGVGGISVAGGGLTVTNCTVSNNTAASGGGGISVAGGGLTINNSTVRQ